MVTSGKNKNLQDNNDTHADINENNHHLISFKDSDSLTLNAIQNSQFENSTKSSVNSNKENNLGSDNNSNVIEHEQQTKNTEHSVENNYQIPKKKFKSITVSCKIKKKVRSKGTMCDLAIGSMVQDVGINTENPSTMDRSCSPVWESIFHKSASAYTATTSSNSRKTAISSDYHRLSLEELIAEDELLVSEFM